MNADFLHAVLFYNLLCLPIWCLIRFFIFKKNKKNNIQINIKYEIILYLFVAYLTSVIALTLIPLSFAEDGAVGYINMTPVVTEIYIMSAELRNHNDISFMYENIYGNILLFAPFGFFIPILFPGRFSFLKVFAIGLFGSSFIETMQWIEMHWQIHRIVDIDDVILNVIGASFGFLLFKLFNVIVKIKKFY